MATQMALAFSAALGAASAAAFAAAEWNRIRLNRAGKWMTAAGRILVSRVIEEENDGVTDFRPEIVYRYDVDGVQYTGDRICFGGVAASSDSVQAALYVRAFPEGSQAVVFFDPRNPSASVLRRDAQPAIRALYGAGTLLLAFSGYAFWTGM